MISGIRRFLDRERRFWHSRITDLEQLRSEGGDQPIAVIEAELDRAWAMLDGVDAYDRTIPEGGHCPMCALYHGRLVELKRVASPRRMSGVFHCPRCGETYACSPMIPRGFVLAPHAEKMRPAVIVWSDHGRAI